MFASIESANVVGYQNNDLQFGTTLVAPAFVDVGTEDQVDLTKIIPGGDSFGSGAITISRLDYAGVNIEDYVYMIPRRGTPGWYNGSTPVAEGEVVFAAGEGIAVSGTSDGLQITTSGEVSTADRTITLQFGTTLCGNHTAVPLDLTTIVPGGDNFASGAITISRLDYAGVNIEDYVYMVPRRGTPGWYNGSTPVAEGEVVFAPGEGFAASGTSDGLNITIPSPTL